MKVIAHMRVEQPDRSIQRLDYPRAAAVRQVPPATCARSMTRSR
jgi:hypothetical protein